MIALVVALAWGRELAGHSHALPVDLDTAFVVSYLAFAQGGSYVSIPNYRYPGIPGNQPLQLAGLTETIQGQARLADRVGVYGLASGGLRVGLDERTILFAGANGGFDARLGLRAVVVTSERTQVAVTSGYRTTSSVGVAPAEVARDVLDRPTSALPGLLGEDAIQAVLVRDRVVQGVLGVATATTLSRAWGLQAALTVRAGRARTTVAEIDSNGPAAGFGAGAAVAWQPGVFGVQLGVRDRLEQDLSDSELLPDRHRLHVPLQLSYDRGDLQLSFVTTTAVGRRRGFQEDSIGLQGRAAAFF